MVIRIITFLSLVVSSIAAQMDYPDSAVVIGYTHLWAATGEASGNRVSVRDSMGWIHAVFSFAWGIPYADSSEIYYVYSTDNGLTWSIPENISQTDSLISYEPNLAIDAQNRLHCVWKQYCEDTTTVYDEHDLYYSQNNGGGWTPAVNISNQGYGSNGCYSSMVVDSRDYVHVVYDMETGPGNWDIFYVFYNDTTWSTPYQVSTSPYDDAGPALAIDHNDNLHVVWRQRTIDGPIYYSKYDGISWTTPEPIASSPGSQAGGPCIIIDVQGYPRVTWCWLLPGNSTEIYYTAFDGVSWSPPLNLSNTIHSSVGSSMAVDSMGNLYVVWMETTDIPDYDIFYRTYNGVAWSGIMNITQDSAFSHCPKLGNPVKGEKVDLIWVSNSDEVVYLSLNLTGILEEESIIIGDRLNLQVYPNPFKQKTEIRFQITDTGATVENIELEIYDVSGRLVRSFSLPTAYSLLPASVTWDGCDDQNRILGTGVYFLRCEVSDYTATKKLLLVR
jgi:hypothetical protein